MIPDSLRRIIQKNTERPQDVTIIWRDGTVIRERVNGAVEQWPSVEPIPQPLLTPDPDFEPFPK